MREQTDITELMGPLPQAVERHLANVARNLQLIADLGYGDVALAVPDEDGQLVVVADARPATAVAALAASRVGETLAPDREIEAYRTLETGGSVCGTRRRITRGISYTTEAHPIGPDGAPYAILVRDVARQVLEAPGRMETQFIHVAEALIDLLRTGPLETSDGEPFATVRVAGDGVLRLDSAGRVDYASPNAVNIMRLAGVEGRVTESVATRLPGGPAALAPVLGARARIASATEVEVSDRVLGYRVVRFEHGAVALVEDRTEARRREQEIKVKDATIREVHHRVKNNLQTIASLLRIQARRVESEEARHALAEANERISSMAVVHDMLASSTEEQIDFTEAARTVVDMVRRGLAGESGKVAVRVEGSTGLVPAQVATSLALVVAEVVHNAIEHGFAATASGTVEVLMRRLPGELVLTVRDDGRGFPEGFDLESTRNLGLAIVRTIVVDNLHGTITIGGGRGATVTVRFPLAANDAPEEG